MKYIFDSSFLISLYLTEDTNNEKAIEIFSKLNENSIFYINEIIFIELLTVITYKKGFKHIKGIKNIINDLNVTMINSGNLEYVKYFEYIGKKISIADCSVLYDSIKYNCNILSFDKDLLKLQ